ncbi:hypothetical protein EC991_003212 [Linnemannia zychae]|nr:hypothetical protein EC991_003212 [Linnemannia zychae]
MNNSSAGTPIPGSPNPQHLDAAQFHVLMSEATNRIKALAELEYAPMKQPTAFATNIELLHPSPVTLTNTHNVPRVYLRRSHSVESLVAESVWSTTAEQVGQFDNQLMFQHQQHFQYVEQQHQQQQHQQQSDYPMHSSMAMMPIVDLNPMSQLAAAHSTSAARLSTAAVSRLKNSSLSKTPPQTLGNKTKHVDNTDNIDDNTRANSKTRSEHKLPINRFVCPLPGCGRTFSRPFNLKSHGMTHETLRPYACDQCDKTFARIHDRDRHLKGHLIEKPHFCVVCLGRFARQDAVTRHLKLAKEKNPCAMILKEHDASFRDAAAGRILRSQLGDEVELRRRFQELEEDAKKIKATKSLEKGMLSMHLLTMNHPPLLSIPLQKHLPLHQQLQAPLVSTSQSHPGRRMFVSPNPNQ